MKKSGIVCYITTKGEAWHPLCYLEATRLGGRPEDNLGWIDTLRCQWKNGARCPFCGRAVR